MMTEKMYLVVSHYSNENINEFNSIGFHGVYESPEQAMTEADKRFREDKENGVDHGDVRTMTDSDNEEFADAVYTVGEEIDGGYNCYHNFYAVVPVSVG